jgi:hypothetical protein
MADEHLDPDPEMHTTRELLTRMEQLVAESFDLRTKLEAAGAPTDSLVHAVEVVVACRDAAEADRTALRAEVDRLHTAIEQALDLGETEAMARGKMPYPDWWVVLDRALDARWQEKAT